MKYVQILFSPTGGTEKVAKAITKNWPSVETVDLTDPDGGWAELALRPEDVALIAMPSYGGLAPQLALDRLGRVRGNSAKCVLAAVYGNRAYEDTLVQMQDAAEGCGFRVIAAVAAVAEHSILRQFATGRPNAADREQLAGFAARIGEKLHSGGLTKPALPGNRPYRQAGGAALVPKASSDCSGCGLCAQKCPARAIDSQSLRTADKAKCISCMRCVAICPRHARKVNGFMASVAARAIQKACAEPKQNELFL